MTPDRLNEIREGLEVTGWLNPRKVAELFTHIDTLTAENAVAQADKVRLDWLANNANDRRGLLIGGICYWSIEKGRDRISEGETLRDAIDAAMKPTGGAS